MISYMSSILIHFCTMCMYIYIYMYITFVYIRSKRYCCLNIPNMAYPLWRVLSDKFSEGRNGEPLNPCNKARVRLGHIWHETEGKTSLWCQCEDMCPFGISFTWSPGPFPSISFSRFLFFGELANLHESTDSPVMLVKLTWCKVMECPHFCW